MSLSLKAANGGYSALSLGGIIGGIGTILGGNPIGGITQVATGIFGGGSKPSTPATPPAVAGQGGCAPGDLACLIRSVPGYLGFGNNGAAPTGACMSGYHLNKHALPPSKKHGAVAARTILVRNRHMNPLNGTAARRAIRRLKSARKAFRDIDRFVGPKRAVGSRSCGCKKK